MKTFTITIEASDLLGVMNSLHEITKVIGKGCISGLDSNDTENFSFESEGDYEEGEEE